DRSARGGRSVPLPSPLISGLPRRTPGWPPRRTPSALRQIGEDGRMVVRRGGGMGGTFDPIHHGHLGAASEGAAPYPPAEVVFVPPGAPWQREERAVSPAEHRYLMTVIATASNPHFWVSRVDVDREGPTYTIDTLRDLGGQLPDAELYFITGADVLGQML